MPGFPPPANQWLAQKLSGLSTDVAALKAQGTEYIVDNEGVCQAIIGHLVAEPNGTSTGLSGWGVAVKTAAGTWEAMPTVGAWTALTLGAKIEAGTTIGQTPRVRAEQGDTSARLRGSLVVQSGQELKGGETLATLPVGFRPPATIVLPQQGTAGFPLVASTGEIEMTGNVPSKGTVFLDGLTFNLT